MIRPGRESPARAFTWSCAIGGVLGTALALWLVTAGTFELLRWQQLGDFYDAQAHSLLDGELAMDPDVLGIEAFVVDGRSYMYQGPLPAILRVPVLALTGDRLDGRLTQLSLLAGLTVALVSASRIHWRVRSHLRGAVPVGRFEAVLVGLFTFGLAAGSPLLFLTSRAWVYHEAVMWGVALSLAAFDQLLAHQARPTTSRLLRASLLTAAALLTRASVALGPLGALFLVWLWPYVSALVLRRSSDAARAGRRPRPTTGWAGAAATAFPIVAYAAVNIAKFGSAFSVPFTAQRQAAVDQVRATFLEANGGSFFGLQFVPTTTVRYLDPSALQLQGALPFVDFPDLSDHTIGHVAFDLQDRAAGLPASAPLLVLLTLVGLVAAFRPRSRSTPLAALRLPLVAAAVGAVAILPFGYVAARYLGDTVPLLAIGGAVGLQVCIARWRQRSRPPRLGVLAVGALVALSAVTQLGLALQYQRLWSTNVEPRLAAGFLGARDDVDRALGGDGIVVERGEALPPARPAGTLFALGDCAGLYLADGLPVTSINRSQWNLVEGTEATGHVRLVLTMPRQPAGTRVPILTAGTAAEPQVLFAEHQDDGRIRFEYRGHDALGKVGPPVRLDPGRTHTVEVIADPNIDRLAVSIGGRIVLETFFAVRDQLAFGTNAVDATVEATFPGTLTVEGGRAPLCQRVTRRAAGPTG